jgi:hypothetical protein
MEVNKKWLKKNEGNGLGFVIEDYRAISLIR